MSTKIKSGVADLMQRSHEAEQARASRLAFAEQAALAADNAVTHAFPTLEKYE